MHLSDWVYEIEPTPSGCRVTHAWVEGPQWAEFAPLARTSVELKTVLHTTFAIWASRSTTY